MAWGFRIRNDAPARAVELDIYEPVGGGMFFGGVSATSVRRTLAQAKDAAAIKVRLNSKGGDVTEGFAIYQDLVDHPANVEVTVTGVAASIASVVAMAGDTIRIAPTGFVMIHDPYAMFGRAGARDLRALAELLDKMTETVADVYAARTQAKREDVLAWMTAETWMTAKEARARGFVDEVLPAKALPAKTATKAFAAFAATASFDGFGNVPPELAAAIDNASKGTLELFDDEQTPPPPAAANPRSGEEDRRNMAVPKELLAKLGLPENASDADAIAAADRIGASAAVSTDLATRVATLEANAQSGGIEAVITRLSTGAQAKLPPSLHAWARTQTVAALEAWAAGAPPINLTPTPATPAASGATPPPAAAAPGGVTPPVAADIPVTMSATELEVCAQLGVDPKAFLEQRKLEVERARMGAQAGA